MILASTLAGFASAAPKLYFSEDSNSNGLFQLDPATGAATLVGLGASGVVNSTVGLTKRGIPACSSVPVSPHCSISPPTARVRRPSELPGWRGWPTTAERHFVWGDQSSFLHGGSVTGERLQSLTGPGGDVEGLAALDGKIYGLNSDSNSLQYYDPGTDAWTTVGGVGISIINGGWLRTAQKLLYFKANASPNLYRLDPATATATLIGSTGISRGGGMGFVRLPSRPMCRSPGREPPRSVPV